MALKLTYDGIKSGEDYPLLLSLSRLVFRKHYSFFINNSEELIYDAIAYTYCNIDEYDFERPIVNFVYTLMRNSMTMGVNKVKKMYPREDEVIKQTPSDKEVYDFKVTIDSKDINRICKDFRLNKYHTFLAFGIFRRLGFKILGEFEKPVKVPEYNDDDFEFVYRICVILINEKMSSKI